MIRTQLQEVGSCRTWGLTLADLLLAADDLGIDPSRMKFIGTGVIVDYEGSTTVDWPSIHEARL